MEESAKQAVKREGLNLGVIVVILVFFLFALHFTVASAVSNLKTEINTTVRVSCLANASAPILAKYNDLVRGLVSQEKTAEALNTAQGFTAKAAANAEYASRFRGDLIAAIHPDCSKPLLP
jgi:hypothetical protein